MNKAEALHMLIEEGQGLKAIKEATYSQDEKLMLNIWINKAYMFADKELSMDEFRTEIKTAYYNKNTKGLTATYAEMFAYLKACTQYYEQPDKVKTKESILVTRKQYDVFISHANADKSEYVNGLKNTIDKLHIRIFYDKDELSWGDNWKERILEGTAKSEFAIIVISNNFFGREWTERELKEFLERQNSSGQKIILPLLYNVSFDELAKQYPSLSDIQCLRTCDYSVEQICILFAKELIKRLKETDMR